MNASLLGKANQVLEEYFDTDPVVCDQEIFERAHRQAEMGLRVLQANAYPTPTPTP